MVKTHVVMTVQEEFDVMKSELEELRSRNMQLEAENSYFRQKHLNDSSNMKRDASTQVSFTSASFESSSNTASGDELEEATKKSPQSSANQISVPGSNMPYLVLGVGSPNIQNLSQNWSANENVMMQYAMIHRQQEVASAQFQTMGGYVSLPPGMLHAVNMVPGEQASSQLNQVITNDDNSVQGEQNGMSTHDGPGATSGNLVGSLIAPGVGVGSSSAVSKAGSDSGRSSLEPQKDTRPHQNQSSGDSCASQHQELNMGSQNHGSNFSQPFSKSSLTASDQSLNSQTGKTGDTVAVSIQQPQSSVNSQQQLATYGTPPQATAFLQQAAQSALHPNLQNVYPLTLVSNPAGFAQFQTGQQPTVPPGSMGISVVPQINHVFLPPNAASGQQVLPGAMSINPYTHHVLPSATPGVSFMGGNVAINPVYYPHQQMSAFVNHQAAANQQQAPSNVVAPGANSNENSLSAESRRKSVPPGETSSASS